MHNYINTATNNRQEPNQQVNINIFWCPNSIGQIPPNNDNIRERVQLQGNVGGAP